MQTTLGRNDLIIETRARAIGGIVLICRELRLRLRLPDEIEVNVPPARVTSLKKNLGNVGLVIDIFSQREKVTQKAY